MHFFYHYQCFILYLPRSHSSLRCGEIGQLHGRNLDVFPRYLCLAPQPGNYMRTIGSDFGRGVVIGPNWRLVRSHKPSCNGLRKTVRLFTELCTSQKVSHLRVHYINNPSTFSLYQITAPSRHWACSHCQSLAIRPFPGLRPKARPRRHCVAPTSGGCLWRVLCGNVGCSMRWAIFGCEIHLQGGLSQPCWSPRECILL